jgi:hypothetical protein
MPRATVLALAVSDEIDPRIHSATVAERLGHVDLVLGCGDLPASYLEFLADALNRPVYFVLGNHAEELTRNATPGRSYQPMGGTDLSGRVVRDSATGLILAGFPGSPRYCEDEPAQYSEWQISWMICRMLPRLWWNRLRHGRALDVLVTHAPPRDVNDRPDPAHRGFKVLRRFLRWFQPAIHLHGHIHLYDRSQSCQQRFEATDVINVFPYKVVELAAWQPAPARRGALAARSPVPPLVISRDSEPTPESGS